MTASGDASEPAQVERNWAGNHVYAGRLVRPGSVEELQHVVRAQRNVGFLGSRHSFNAIADADVLIDMRGLPPRMEVDAARRRVTVSGGTTYGTLAPVLEQHGLALPNLASLSHITVAGAIAIGTHGSGVRNGGLATAVAGLEIVRADGELIRVERGDAAFDGCVVSLGALGAVVSVTLELEPTYQVRQWVIEDVPWSSLLDDLHAVMACAYSVSLFTLWDGDVRQAWFKERLDTPARLPVLRRGTPATRDVHPIPGLDAANATRQMGVAGPWFDRLPHFRIGFTPSNGNELQSEFLVDWSAATDAIGAMQRIGAQIRPLLQICEVRAVAGDTLWMSPAFERESLAIHFTWQPDAEAVESALAKVEAALLPLGARPHWGKVFLAAADDLANRYAELMRFAALRDHYDPERAFSNPWLERHVFGTAAPSRSVSGRMSEKNETHECALDP
jgi:alditol oxidase